jgi:hypothetical protein
LVYAASCEAAIFSGFEDRALEKTVVSHYRNGVFSPPDIECPAKAPFFEKG